MTMLDRTDKVNKPDEFKFQNGRKSVQFNFQDIVLIKKKKKKEEELIYHLPDVSVGSRYLCLLVSFFFSKD